MSAVDDLRTALYGSPPVDGYKPSRSGVLAAFTELYNIALGAISGAAPYLTRAALPASTGSNAIALVTSDSTITNNGYWQDQTTGWVYLTDLNTVLKGNPGTNGSNGTLAAATLPQIIAATDNTTSVTPLGLSLFGLNAAVVAEPSKRKSILDDPSSLYFASLLVVTSIVDQNNRGVFLTSDGMLRGRFGIAAGSGAATNYDPSVGVTTISIPSIATPLGTYYVNGSIADLIFTDGQTLPAVYAAGLRDGRFYVPKLVVGAITRTDGTSIGGSNFVDTAPASFSSVSVSGLQQIQRFDKISGSLTTITSLGNNINPARSADGNNIIYNSDRNGGFGLYFQPVTGGPEHPYYSTPRIVIIGDSRSTASLGYVTPFSALAAGRTIDVEGRGGQRTAEIAARFGAVATTLVVTGNQIPASGSVAVSTVTPPIFNAFNTTTGAIHGSISSIAGTLTFDGNGNTAFVRDVAGTATTVPNPATFIPDSGTISGSTSASTARTLASLQDDILLIGPGFNDIQQGLLVSNSGFTYNQANALANIAATVAAAKTLGRKFLVLGVYSSEALLQTGSGGIASGQSTLGTAASQVLAKSAVDAVVALNAALLAAYPNNFVDRQAAIIAAGYGETATVNGVGGYVIVNATAAPDGFHATLAAAANADAAAIWNAIAAKGW